MQDELVFRLANALNTQLITAEARRAERVPSPDSMDSYFQGMAWLNKGSMLNNNLVRAQTYFERALAIDPDNVDALAQNAFADVQIVVSGTPLTKRLLASRRPKRLRPKPYPSRQTTLALTGLSALSMALQTEASEQSPNVRGRWRLIVTLSSLTRSLACISFILIAARKPRLTC